MHSHVHLFLQPSEAFSLEKTMHFINGTYAREYNLKNKRKGHLWLDRYKSIPVESDKHALDLMRYINRNALRAGIVTEVGKWKWSGYRFYAFGEPNDLLEAHPTYLGLSTNPKIRQSSFRSYVSQNLSNDREEREYFSQSKFIGSSSFAQALGLSTGL
ncbi:MAG: transposase [Deltaproteobacteria bacterium]|nr:MAG: transposase [Deltaproteobacteria bacterium]